MKTSTIYPLRSTNTLRNYLKTPLCHSELVSESPKEGNNPDEILKQVQDDTFLFVLRSFLSAITKILRDVLDA